MSSTIPARFTAHGPLGLAGGDCPSTSRRFVIELLTKHFLNSEFDSQSMTTRERLNRQRRRCLLIAFTGSLMCLGGILGSQSYQSSSESSWSLLFPGSPLPSNQSLS
jgi:hypothetical protein